MAGPGFGGPVRFLTEEEKQSAPKLSRGLLKRIFSYMTPYWVQFLFVFITILVSATIGLMPAIITGRIVDDALVGKNMTLLVQLLIAAFAAMLVSQLVGLVENYINAWISQQIIFDMRNQMYRHLLYMPHSFFTTEKQGDIITRMNSDISGVGSVISGTLANIVNNIAVVLTTLVALFRLSPPLAAVGIVAVPLLVIPTRMAGRTRWKYLSLSQAKSDELNQKVDETLSVSGAMLVRIFTREEKEYKDFVNINKEVTGLSLKEQRAGQLFRVAMGMFNQIGPLLIYFCGGYFIIRRIDPGLTVGIITSTVSLVNRINRPVEQLLNLSVDFTRSLALFSRIFDYFDKKNPITSPENGVKPDVNNKPVTYEHVAFSYSPDSKILKDVNFEVPGGAMYAIVGPSGSGKSTVVNLIPRIYDVDSGSVKIGGVDVRDFDLEYLRSQIGVVTQESYLFNGTIRDNLKYAKQDATQEEIEAACRIANIHDFIVSQPDGYETQVGNRGLKLSGGEKQRLSLARVILKDTKILILDEATSALDSISENSIQDALEQMMKGRTSIVIAHRLSTILKANMILVVDKGEIVEKGSHEELLALGGTYKELYETQFRKAIDSEAERAASDKEDIRIETLSTQYRARELSEEDVLQVYNLARSNSKYYRMIGSKPSKESLADYSVEQLDEAAVKQKHFVGFYDTDDDLVAVMDLITGYPGNEDAFIGWLMVDGDRQGKGVGSGIFADVRASMKADGYDYLSVSCRSDDTDSIGFWKSQGFEALYEKQSGDHSITELGRAI